jgi:hypothetical protein
MGLGPNEIPSPYTDEKAQFGTVRAASFTFWYVQEAYLVNRETWMFINRLRRSYGFRDLHEALSNPVFKSWWLKGLQSQLCVFQALALCAEAYNEAGQAFDVRPSGSRTLTGFNLQFWQEPIVAYNGKEYRQGDVALLRDRVPFEGVARTDGAWRLETPRQALIFAQRGVESVVAWAERTENLNGKLAYPIAHGPSSSLAQTMGVPFVVWGAIIVIGLATTITAGFVTAPARDRAATNRMMVEQAGQALDQAAMYSVQCAEGNENACDLALQWQHTAESLSDNAAEAIKSENNRPRGQLGQTVGEFAKLIKWGVIGGVAFYGLRQISEMQKARGE